MFFWYEQKPNGQWESRKSEIAPENPVRGLRYLDSPEDGFDLESLEEIYPLFKKSA